MKNIFSNQEKIQRNFWDSKSSEETFEKLDWPGEVERDEFFKFADLTTNLKVLEIGAGTGRWTIPLLKMGHSITATDISEKSLNILKSKAKADGLEKKLTVLVDNFEKPIFPKSFDAIFCFGVVHHFDPLKRESILANIVGTLKDKGKIFIIEPHPFNILFYLIYFWRWIANQKNVNRWSTEKGFLQSSVWRLKKDFNNLDVADIQIRWYGYLPSRFALSLPLVLEFNAMMNKIPFFRLFSAYIWIKGTKNAKEKR